MMKFKLTKVVVLCALSVPALVGRGHVEADKAAVTMRGRGRSLSDEAAAGFFDVFSTVRNSTHAEALGLKPVVAERIISLYGGSVQIRSMAPQDVELKIVLPIHRPDCSDTSSPG